MLPSSSWSRSHWCRGCPGFQDIPLEDLANIAVRMHLQVVPARQVIIRQGEPGDYMYFIAHGVVRVSRAEHGVSRDLATMMAGEFFGEAALLSERQPRNATVTAVTPCTLYRLHRDDLQGRDGDATGHSQRTGRRKSQAYRHASRWLTQPDC